MFFEKKSIEIADRLSEEEEEEEEIIDNFNIANRRTICINCCTDA